MKFCNLKTWVNKDDVKVGDEGYFANDICILEKNIERDFKHKIKHIDQFRGNCFVAEIDDNEPSCCSAYSGYTFFLPSERARKPTYRPFANVGELFDFLMPTFNEDHFGVCDEEGNHVEFDVYEKAEILLGKKLVLKDLVNDRIKIVIIQDIDFIRDSNNSRDIFLNSMSLEYLFNDFEIQHNGEFIPFGIEE